MTRRCASTSCPDSGPRPDCAEWPISEAQPRAVFEHTLDGILLTEPDGQVFAANPAACRLLRHSEAELRRLTWRDLVNSTDVCCPATREKRDQERYWERELTLLRGDGSTIETEVTSLTVDHKDSAVTTVVIRDTSERRTAEARVKEQAAWLDKANESILVTDLDHRITFWNKGAERMIGWAAAEVLGKTMSELLSLLGVSDPQVIDAAGRMTDWRGTLRCQHRNGEVIVISSSATVLRDPEDRSTGRLCICSDITEQTQLRERYERAQRLQSIGMVAAGVAHDMNNILTPVRLALPLLQSRLHHAEDLELINTIGTCVTRGAAVVRQILGFAQGMGGDARVIDLRPVMREVAEIVRETFPRAIALAHDIPPDLWPVLANPTQIHQLLLNLCINARDAMPRGGHLRLCAENRVLDEQAAARISGGRPGSHVILSVEDTGTGIAPGVLARVWEPFFTTKSAKDGTGLGLATVRSIVESHAGFIAVETAPGHGSIFRVFLPAVITALPPDDAKPPTIASRGGSETLLLVDDERIVRDVAKALLVRAGYQVVTAAHGAEALAIVQERPERFDLVITDIDMPELDGVGLAHALRSTRPGLPIMAMSGLTSAASRAQQPCFSAGFLPKPFTADALFQAVREAVLRRA